MLNQYIETGDIEFISHCIRNKETQLSQPDYNGNTPIHLASALGQEKVLSLLISPDAQKCDIHIDARATYTQATPLHFSSRNGRQGTTNLLLENGADVNAKDAKGWTPLHYAVFRNHPTIAGQLIAKGADVNARTGDGTGYTPLHLACYCGVTEIVALLIRNGADFCAKDDKGAMPFDLLPLVKPKKEEEYKHHKASHPNNSSGSRRKSSSGSNNSSNNASSSTDELIEEECTNALRDAVKTSHKHFRQSIFSGNEGGIAPQFTDFTIKFADSEEVLKCHKIVMEARSPFLRDELETDLTLEEHTVKSGFGPAAFRMFLEWCYTGAVEKLSAPLTKADIPAVVQLIMVAYTYVSMEKDAATDEEKLSQCLLPELCIAAIADNFSQEFLPVIIDEIMRYEPCKFIERLGAGTLGAVLGLPESDNLAQSYELFKKLPVDTMEGVVLSLNVMGREVKTAPRIDHGAQADPLVDLTALEQEPEQQQQAAQEVKEEAAGAAAVAADDKQGESYEVIFTLEFAQVCPSELKRKIKATNTKINNSTLSYMLSEGNVAVCRDMLATLRSIQNPGWFDFPVPDSQEYAPNYYNIVTKPMDLGTLETMLVNRELITVGEFITLGRQIWQNCFMYNPKGTPIFVTAKEMGMRFESLIQAAKFESDYNEGDVNESVQYALKDIICNLDEDNLTRVLEAAGIKAEGELEIDLSASFNSIRKAFYSVPRRLLDMKITEPLTKKQKI